MNSLSNEQLERYRREVILESRKNKTEADDTVIELADEFKNIFSNPIYPLGSGQRLLARLERRKNF